MTVKDGFRSTLRAIATENLALKQDSVAAKNIPEAPSKPAAEKNAKPNIDPKAKANAPGEKEKLKAPKKTNEKRFIEPGKLTAVLSRPRGRARSHRYKVET